MTGEQLVSGSNGESLIDLRFVTAANAVLLEIQRAGPRHLLRGRTFQRFHNVIHRRFAVTFEASMLRAPPRLRQQNPMTGTGTTGQNVFFSDSFVSTGLSTPESSRPYHSYQSSPRSSIGCWVRSEPFPHPCESTGQYLSHPQQIRSGCFGCKGNFLAIVRNMAGRVCPATLRETSDFTAFDAPSWHGSDCPRPAASAAFVTARGDTGSPFQYAAGTSWS